eukprot:COSAG05_NODE_439_length_9821_cov_110.691556_2_plen_257_part_00
MTFPNPSRLASVILTTAKITTATSAQRAPAQLKWLLQYFQATRSVETDLELEESELAILESLKQVDLPAAPLLKTNAANTLVNICLLTNGGCDDPELANTSAIALMTEAERFIHKELLSRLVTTATALDIDHLLGCLKDEKGKHAWPLVLQVAKEMASDDTFISQLSQIPDGETYASASYINKHPQLHVRSSLNATTAEYTCDPSTLTPNDGWHDNSSTNGMLLQLQQQPMQKCMVKPQHSKVMDTTYHLVSTTTP